MLRLVGHSLVRLVLISFVGAMSSAAVAQQAPPDLCHEDAVSQCNYGSWQTKGYSSEEQCIEDNSQYCNDGGTPPPTGYCIIRNGRLECY